MQQRQASSDSLASVFSQALSIISRGSSGAPSGQNANQDPGTGLRAPRSASQQHLLRTSSIDTNDGSSYSQAELRAADRRRSERHLAVKSEGKATPAGEEAEVEKEEGGEEEGDSAQLRREREARSIAIEKAYVHDVYEQISQHISDSRYRAWPRVKQFLQELEPGSIVCDVGEFFVERKSFNPG